MLKEGEIEALGLTLSVFTCKFREIYYKYYYIAENMYKPWNTIVH